MDENVPKFVYLSPLSYLHFLRLQPRTIWFVFRAVIALLYKHSGWHTAPRGPEGLTT
jgi:hypothetical protein